MNNQVKKYFTRIHQVITGALYYSIMTALIISIVSFLISLSSTGQGTIFGYKPILTLTGSMEPTMREKSIVIGRELNETTVQELQKGDIVTFRIIDEGREKRITHRIIDIDFEYMTIQTKGDNNDSSDLFDMTIYPHGIPFENIDFKVVKIFNFTAVIFSMLTATPLTLFFIAIGLLGVFILWKVIRDLYYEPEYEFKFLKKNKTKPVSQDEVVEVNQDEIEVNEDENLKENP